MFPNRQQILPTLNHFRKRIRSMLWWNYRSSIY